MCGVCDFRQCLVQFAYCWRMPRGSSRGCGCRRRRVRGRCRCCPRVDHYCSPTSVYRKLAAVSSFCELNARHTPGLAGLLVSEGPDRRRSGATSYKPFLQHISGGGMSRRLAIRVREAQIRRGF
jgi:hypothetical protein